MLAGLLCALVLVGALFVAHVRPGGVTCAGGSTLGWLSRRTWLGLGALLVASLPLLSLAPGVRNPPDAFWGDTASHARVAAEVARTGLPHGWLDSYLGGFPIGHHYPPLGWLLLAGGIRCGLSPGAAVTALGFASALAFVLAVYFGLARCRVRPEFACLGASVLGWVSPYNPFVGGYETFFTAGLVSQALAMPLCTWLVVATLRNEHRGEAAVFAWVSMASHPQIAVATVVVLGLAVWVSGRRTLVASAVWTAVFALLAGAALYGQGMGALGIPFGWPPDLGWRQLGFPPQRLSWWFIDGDLLDAGRAPVITASLAAACLILLLGFRRASNRVLLVALLLSLLLAVSGRWLRDTGAIGAVLLSFLQPLRVISLVPPLVAVAIAVGMEQGALGLKSALSAVGRARLGSYAPALVGSFAFGIAGIGLPSRLSYTDTVSSGRRGGAACGGEAQQMERSPRDEVRSWVAELSGARLWYEAFRETPLSRCLDLGAVDVSSAVPPGTTAAVGAHVGVLARAAQFLAPERPGSTSRAQALGIGYLLLDGAERGPPSGWVVRARRGDIQLVEQSAALVGVGCIERRWVGGPERIRSRLNAELAQPPAADVLLDPHRFTALEYGSGEVVVSPWPETGCDERSASVITASARSGEVSAEVESGTPVDVVFRFSAFPTWRVSIDGVPASAPTLIAPGFFSVRVAPGAHRLTAEVSSLPHYGALLALAALATTVLAAGRGRFGLVASWIETRLRRR